MGLHICDYNFPFALKYKAFVGSAVVNRPAFPREIERSFFRLSQVGILPVGLARTDGSTEIGER